MFDCHGSTNQQWVFQNGLLASVGNSGNCLSAVGDNPQAVQFVVNESGTGELSFYGSNLASYCIAACPMN